MKTTSPFHSSDPSPQSAAASIRNRVSLSRKTHRWLATAALIAGVSGHAFSEVPQLLNYQGRVAVEGGTNVSRTATGAQVTASVTKGTITGLTVTNAGAGYTGSAWLSIAAPPPNIVFQTYWSNTPDSTPTDGEPDAAVSLPVNKGLYSVLLGDTSRAHMAALPAGVFANPDVRLRVWFNDGTHGFQKLAPDSPIAAAGYAMVAGGLAPGVTIPASVVVNAPPGMVHIPAGSFTMGDTLDGVSNATHEVTFSQWQAVYFWATSHGYTFANPGAGKSANHPVQTVNWNDVVKWCNARSQMEGLPGTPRPSTGWHSMRHPRLPKSSR